ncbi:MAG: hypothetical protein JWQ53_2174 [Klenkia sp.]|nr:hypothetical protein [Klenkia sp.]
MTAGRLLLVRHGQSEANVALRLDSLPPGAPLTQDGQAQARALVETLRGTPVAAVLASRAVRAQQTAAPLAAALGLDVDVRDGLQETFVGDLEGQAGWPVLEEYDRAYGQWFTGAPEVAPPGGESGHDVLARYLPVVEDVRRTLAADPHRSVVVVSHGAAIRWVVTSVSDLPATFAMTTHVANTELAVLAPVEGGWVCERFGAHLPPFEVPDEDAPVAPPV